MLFKRFSTSKNSLRIYQSIYEVHLFLFPSKYLRILNFIRINDHFVLNNQYLHTYNYLSICILFNYIFM